MDPVGGRGKESRGTYVGIHDITGIFGSIPYRLSSISFGNDRFQLGVALSFACCEVLCFATA